MPRNHVYITFVPMLFNLATTPDILLKNAGTGQMKFSIAVMNVTIAKSPKKKNATIRFATQYTMSVPASTGTTVIAGKEQMRLPIAVGPAWIALLNNLFPKLNTNVIQRFATQYSMSVPKFTEMIQVARKKQMRPPIAVGHAWIALLRNLKTLCLFNPSNLQTNTNTNVTKECATQYSMSVNAFTKIQVIVKKKQMRDPIVATIAWIALLNLNLINASTIFATP